MRSTYNVHIDADTKIDYILFFVEFMSNLWSSTWIVVHCRLFVVCVAFVVGDLGHYWVPQESRNGILWVGMTAWAKKKGKKTSFVFRCCSGKRTSRTTTTSKGKYKDKYRSRCIPTTKNDIGNDERISKNEERERKSHNFFLGTVPFRSGLIRTTEEEEKKKEKKRNSEI